jgi:hypothetical protein
MPAGKGVFCLTRHNVTFPWWVEDSTPVKAYTGWMMAKEGKVITLRAA